jgi:hypothetical protein
MKDLTNIASSNEYKEFKNKIIEIAYNDINKNKVTEVTEGDLKRIITEYRSIDKKYYCSNNKVYNKENIYIFEYFNLYHHHFFCNKIKYKNGKEYIFYKSSLYGYNVFEIDTQETFDYYPKCSFGENSIETFIGTDIHFNEDNNIFAVGGCYWACPVDTFLVKIDDPLKQYEKYVNIHSIIDKEYENYDDIIFIRWEGNDIKLKCYKTIPNENEIIVLNEKQYIERM